jgi:hypothetical protein
MVTPDHNFNQATAVDAAARSVAAPAMAPVKVFDGILVPYQTPVRRSLTEWATAIRDRFYAAKEQVQSDLVGGAGVIINCFNETALIEVYFGREEKAGELCGSCIQWLDRNSRRPGGLVILQYAFEPYLNLGRLDRIRQRDEEALRKFQVVEKVACGQEAYLGEHFIPAELSREIFSRTTALPRLMRTAFILEWVKTLLKCRQYSEVSTFNPSWHNPGDLTARDVLWESKIIALCYLGRHDDALAAGNPGLADREGLNRTLFLFRRAETFAAADRIEDAFRVAGNLATGFLNYPGTVSMTRLGLLVRLTVLLRALGSKDVLRLAELGYKSATALGDIVFQSEFLKLMADIQGHEGDALRAKAANIRRSGWYGTALNNTQASTGAIENLTEELLLYSKQDFSTSQSR